MTVLANLLTGTGPPVLQTCRFEGLGGRLYGREAIGDALAALRPTLSAALLDVQTDRLGLWMDGPHAVIADLNDGHVGRLWLLSARSSLEAGPRVDVPFDADLAQAIWRPSLDPRDNPGLEPGDTHRLTEAVADWPFDDLARPRPVVLRAASVGKIVVALVRVEGERRTGSATPVAFNGAIVLRPEGTTYRVDEAGRAQAFAQPWTPRL